MRKSLFCLFLFLMTLPAFSDDKFTVDTQIEWNGDVVADAIRSVDLDQDTSNRILVDLLLDRNTFSVSDAVGECKKHCNQLSQPSQDFCPTVCEDFATNLVTINNERAGKSVKDCPDGTYDIGFAQCVNPTIDGLNSSSTNTTWETVFPYGTVSGIAVCNDTSGSCGVSSPNDMQETGGKYCWCKMTHPAVSLWVFGNEYSSSSGCAFNCVYYCGGLVRVFSGFRSGVFSSVGK